MNNNPIGVFDSGSGGLSIVKSIQTQLPNESLVYLGDHLYSPYGNKDTQFIRDRTLLAISYLIAQHVKIIVIACNTATIAGIDFFREQFPDVPIIGVVPVIKTAANLSKTKHFVVLSTEYTAKSDYQKNLISQYAADCQVHASGSSLLVPLIESGKVNGPEVEDELRRMLHHDDAAGGDDVVVLGCTHYPFLSPVIRDIMGEDVPILDSGDAVARQVKRILEQRDGLAPEKQNTDIYVTTGDEIKVAHLFSVLLSKNIPIEHVNI